MEAFVAQEALARFGYAPKDVVRATERQEPTSVVAAPAVAAEPEVEGFPPSEREMDALTYVKNRLFYLVRTDALFQEVQKITYRKTKTSFRVYYGRVSKGSLFDYKENRNGLISLQFPALDRKDVTYVFSAKLDECLLNAFTLRVKEAGISYNSPPVLRTITGGQPSGTA